MFWGIIFGMLITAFIFGEEELRDWISDHYKISEDRAKAVVVIFKVILFCVGVFLIFKDMGG